MATLKISQEMWEALKGKMFIVWVKRYITEDVTWTFDKKLKVFELTLPSELLMAKMYILYDQVIESGYPLAHFWRSE